MLKELCHYFLYNCTQAQTRQVHMYMYGLGLASVKMDCSALTIRFQVAGVTATSRWGIKQLRISFGSIFPLP